MIHNKWFDFSAVVHHPCYGGLNLAGSQRRIKDLSIEHLRCNFLGKYLTATSRFLFLQKSSIIDAWNGPEYASSNYYLVLLVELFQWLMNQKKQCEIFLSEWRLFNMDFFLFGGWFKINFLNIQFSFSIYETYLKNIFESQNSNPSSLKD